MIMESINEKGHVKERFRYKTNLNGYSLAVNNENSIAVLSDPLKYVVAYDFNNGNIASICRFSNHNMINYFEFLEDAVVCGDCAGYLQIL